MAAPFDIRLDLLVPAGPAFRGLLDESLLEGYGMLARLGEGWIEGANRFDRPGEMLSGAWIGERLAGVCGLNVDSYVPTARQGRVRHLYVAPACRRHGVGRALVDAVVRHAKGRFPMLNLRAPPEAFAFYDSPGFARTEGLEFVTHRLVLPHAPRDRI